MAQRVQPEVLPHYAEHEEAKREISNNSSKKLQYDLEFAKEWDQTHRTFGGRTAKQWYLETFREWAPYGDSYAAERASICLEIIVKKSEEVDELAQELLREKKQFKIHCKIHKKRTWLGWLYDALTQCVKKRRID